MRGKRLMGFQKQANRIFWKLMSYSSWNICAPWEFEKYMSDYTKRRLCSVSGELLHKN
jgi:hypothetical protein